MIHFSKNKARMVFGDKHHALLLDTLKTIPQADFTAHIRSIIHEPFVHATQVNQVHGTEGHAVCAQSDHYLKAGDYLITHTPGIAIGISTADCAPVFIYDAEHQVLGVAHAGWRGTVAGIVSKMLNHMQHDYAIKPTACFAYIGPSARSCCYEVKEDLIAKLSPAQKKQSISEKNGRHFLDKTRLIQYELITHGVPEKSIDISAAVCTICNPIWCSHRREPVPALRQLSVGLLLE
jgi:polyphenol oxidase